MANQINKEHINYYKTLEAIRRSGVCNMWGGSAVSRRYGKHFRRESRRSASRMDN